MSRKFTVRLFPRSLAGRLILLLLLALILSQIVSFFMFQRERRQALRTVGVENVVSRTVALARLISQSPAVQHRALLRTASTRRLRFSLHPQPAITATEQETADRQIANRLANRLQLDPGRVLVRMAKPPERLFGGAGPRFGRHRDAHPGQHYGRRRPRLPFLDISIRLTDGQWLNVASSVPQRRTRWFGPFRFQLLLMALAITGIVIFSIRKLTRPLKKLAAAAERLGRGEAVAPLPEDGAMEVRQTTRAFNEMQARLSRFVTDRTAMLGAISHDLRTPITSLRLRAEFIDDPDIKTKMLATLDEMEEMTEAVLAFVREDTRREDTQLTDLAALVAAICADFSDTGRDVSCRLPAEPLLYNCRPQSLKRALRNIVDNAVKYAGSAKVSLARVGDEFEIRVADDGPGLPEARLEEVFQPFVRGEESRSRETGGSGLGLAIARSILRNHGGDVVLRNRTGGGLSATLRLPAVAA